jgi:hypothetical protein
MPFCHFLFTLEAVLQVEKSCKLIGIKLWLEIHPNHHLALQGTGRHSTQHDDIQHNDTKSTGLIFYTQHDRN